MTKQSTLPISVSQLNINNFRLFSALEVKLHPELTVFIAPNSGGKTTIVDAISSLLIALIDPAKKGIYTEYDLKKNNNTHLNSLALLLNLQKDYLTSLDFKWEFYTPNKNRKNERLKISSLVKNNTYSREFIDLNLKKNIAIKATTNDLYYVIEHLLNKNNPKDLPLFAYFMANRRIKINERSNRLEIKDLSRKEAYQYLVSSQYKNNLNLFEQWLRERELSGLEEWLETKQEGEQGTPEPNTHLIAVSSVLATMLSHEVDIKTVKYFARSKRIQAVTHDDVRLDIDQLSHGAKSILAIAAELTMRCCALNPHLKAQAPQYTAGIVLIDEIDLHLHPKWQQHIIADFRQCFPKMQFIITTHSPAILSTVKKENIREIKVNTQTGKSTANEPLVQSYGESIADTLETIMNVSARPDNPLVHNLNSYLDWAENGNLSEDKQEQRQALEAELGESHMDLLTADLIIRRRKILSARK